VEEEEKLVCVLRSISFNGKLEKKNLEKLEGLPLIKYIHHEKFKNTLNKNYVDEIILLLEDNIEINATSTDELTPSKLSLHKIKLKARERPIKQRFYHLTKLKSDILKEELTKLIVKKFIEPSYSEWSSPVVLVPKPNGKWRLCINYRKVNDVTEKRFLFLTKYG